MNCEKEEKYNKLKKDLRGIEEDAMDLFESRKTYKDILSKNPDIKEPNDFYYFLKLTYISYAVLSVCRLADHNKDSVSLYNLLHEIFDDPKKYQKNWFINEYKQILNFEEGPDPNFGEGRGKRDFEENFGKLDFIDPSIVYADIGRLIFYTKEIKKFRNKRIAHKDKNRKLKFEVNFNDLDKSIDVIEDLIKKYHLLLYTS